MTPTPTQKRAKLGRDPPIKPDPRVPGLQHGGLLDNTQPPTLSPPQQAVEKQNKYPVSPFGLSGDGSGEEGEHNDAVRPNALIHRYGIQGGTEGFDSAPAKTDRTNNRLHEEAEASGEEADDGGASNEHVTPEDQAHVRPVYKPLRRGKRKWEIRRWKEDEARTERERGERSRALSAPAHAGAYRPLPKEVLGEESDLTIQPSVKAEEQRH
jgi:hypothetical protein